MSFFGAAGVTLHGAGYLLEKGCVFDIKSPRAFPNNSVLLFLYVLILSELTGLEHAACDTSNEWALYRWDL